MDYMKQALSLAKLALGQVSPNPAVGAIVVKDDVVVGQGYTQPPGSWHAEVMALKQAGGKSPGWCNVCYFRAVLPPRTHTALYQGGYCGRRLRSAHCNA